MSLVFWNNTFVDIYFFKLVEAYQHKKYDSLNPKLVGLKHFEIFISLYIIRDVYTNISSLSVGGGLATQNNT